MRRWIWYICPAIIFRWYFFYIGKFYVNFNGEKVLCERLDEELLIIHYPTNKWYENRHLSLPEARKKDAE